MISAPKGVMTSTRSNQGPGRIPNGSVGHKPDPHNAKVPYKPCRKLDVFCAHQKRVQVGTRVHKGTQGPPVRTLAYPCLPLCILAHPRGSCVNQAQTPDTVADTVT